MGDGRAVVIRPSSSLWSQGVEPDFRIVAQLRAGDVLLQSWQAAVDHNVDCADVALSDLLAGPHRLAFAFPAAREQLLGLHGTMRGLRSLEQES
jgi:hypothetical protein